MKLRSALVTLSTIGILASVSPIASAQSEAQDPPPATSELNKEIITEDDQRERKPPRQATHNIGLQNGAEVVCKKSKVKGTRLRAHKTCKTRAQWDVDRVNTKNQLDQMKARTSVGQAR